MEEVKESPAEKLEREEKQNQCIIKIFLQDIKTFKTQLLKGKPSPFVKISLRCDSVQEEQKQLAMFQTEVKKSDCAPIFNQVYTFDHQRKPKEYERDYIKIEVLDYTRIGTPSVLGVCEIDIQKDIIQKQNEVKNEKGLEIQKQLEQTKEKAPHIPKIRMQIDYKSIGQQVVLQQGIPTAKEQRYRGALKINFLTIQKGFQSKDTKKGFINVIYGGDKNNFNKTGNETDTFKTPNFTKDTDQLNYAMIIPLKQDPKKLANAETEHQKNLIDSMTNMKFELINPTEQSGDVRPFADCDFDLEQKDVNLYENQPKTYQICFKDTMQNNIQRTSLVELKFLKNHFVDKVLKGGFVQISVVDLKLIHMENAVFQYQSSSNGTTGVFGKQGTKILVQVSQIQETINIKMYGKQQIADYAKDQNSLTFLNPDDTQRIILADLNWKCTEEGEKGIESYARTKTIFTSPKFQAAVEFQIYFRQEAKWSKQLQYADNEAKELRNATMTKQSHSKEIQETVSQSAQKKKHQQQQQQQQQKQNLKEQNEQSEFVNDDKDDNNRQGSLQNQQLSTQFILQNQNQNVAQQEIQGITTISQMKKQQKQKEVYLGGKRYIFDLKQMRINNINLQDMFKKNPEASFNMFVQIKVSNASKIYYSHTVSKSQQWDKLKIPITIEDLNSSAQPYIEFKVYDTTLQFDVHKEGELEKNTPYPLRIIELFKFKINVQDLLSIKKQVKIKNDDSDSASEHENEVKETNKTQHEQQSCEFSPEFVKFWQQSTGNSWQTVEQLQKASALKIDYQLRQSIYIDKPVGILSIDSLKGESLSFLNSDDFQPTITYELGNQIERYSQNTGSGKHPSFMEKINFVTFNEVEYLKINLIDSSSGQNIVRFNSYIALHEFQFYSTRIYNHVIDLEEYNSELTGQLILSLSYNPIKVEKHPYYYFKLNPADKIDPLDQNEQPQYWGSRHTHHMQEENKRDIFTQNLTNCRVKIKLKLLTAQVPGLQAGDKFRIILKQTDQRGISTYIQGTNRFEYVYSFQPQQDFEFQVNPHQEDTEIQAELQITKKEINTYEKNSYFSSIQWQNYPIRKYQKNQIQIDFLDIQGCRLKFEMSIIEDTVSANSKFGLMHLKFQQLRIMNFFLQNVTINHIQNYVYVLRVTIGNYQDQNYVINSQLNLPQSLKSVVFQNDQYLDSVQQIQNIQNYIAIEPSRQDVERSYSFTELITYLVQSKDDIVNFEFYQVADSKTDFQLLDKKEFHLYKNTDLLYKGQITNHELLQHIQKPKESINIAVKMVRYNPPSLVKNDEHMSNKAAQLQEETYLFFNYNFDPILDKMNDQNQRLIADLDVKNQVRELEKNDSQKDSYLDQVSHGIYEIQMKKVQQFMYNQGYDIYGNIIDFRKVNKMIVGGTKPNALQTQRADSKESSQYFMERSDKVYNGNIFNNIQQLFKVFTPSSVQHFFITLTQLYIDKIKIGQGQKAKVGLLFRDMLKEYEINLDNLELEPWEKLQIHQEILNNDLKQSVVNFNVQLNTSKFTMRYDQNLIVNKIEVFGLEKNDNPFLYFDFRICYDKNDIDEERLFQTCYTGDMKEAQEKDCQHLSIKDHTPSTRFIQEFKDDEENNCLVDESSFEFYTRNITDTFQISICDSSNNKSKQISRYSYPLYLYNIDLGGEIIDFVLFVYTKEQAKKLIRVRLHFALSEAQIAMQATTKLNIFQIQKIKFQLNKIKERLHKVFYFDSEMNGYQFDATFRKKFKNLSANYVKEEFKQMKALKCLNNDGFKKYLPDEPDIELIHFMIPKSTSLKLNGSFNIKYPLNIVIELTSSKWKESIKTVHEMRSDSFTINVQRDDDGEIIVYTEIIMNEDIDFYFRETQLKQCEEATLIFKYMNKDNSIKIEKGAIEKNNLKQLFDFQLKEEEDKNKYFESSFLIVLIRPSNLKLFLGARKMVNHFIDNPVGKLKINFHRIVKISDIEMKNAKSFSDVWDDISSEYYDPMQVYIPGDRVIFKTYMFKCMGTHESKDPKKNQLFWVDLGENDGNNQQYSYWDKTKTYRKDNTVIHSGRIFKCTGKILGIEPNQKLQNSSWFQVPSDLIQGFWDKEKKYQPGDQVIFQKRLFRARQANQGTQPKLLLRYENKLLLAKNDKEASQFSKCYTMLKMKVNGQKFYTELLDNEGNVIMDNAQFSQYEYYTSHIDDRIDFKLLLSGKQEFTSQEKQDINQQTQNLVSKDDKLEKQDQFLKTNKQINVCKGKLHISDIVYHKYQPESQYYFLCPLTKMQYHANDTLQSFYNFLDREDLYVLGSLQYKEQGWVNIVIDIMNINNIYFNLENEYFQNQNDDQFFETKIVYLALRVKTFSTHDQEEDQEITEFECPYKELTFGNIIKQQSQEDFQGFSFEFTPSQRMRNIYVEDPNIQNIISNFQLYCIIDGQQEQLLCQRFFPLKKFSEPKYLNNSTEVHIDLQDHDYVKKQNQIIQMEEKKFPQLYTVFQGLRDIKPKSGMNMFEAKLKKQKEKQQQLEENTVFDFRSQKLTEMLSNLINTSSSATAMSVLKELHELFIFEDYVNYKKDYELCIRILLFSLKIYYHDTSIMAEIIQNLFSLVIMDIKKSRKILIGEKIFDLLSELSWDMIQTQFPNQQDQKIVKDTINKLVKQKQKIKVLKHNSADTTEPITTEMLDQRSVTIEQIQERMMQRRKQYLTQQGDINEDIPQQLNKNEIPEIDQKKQQQQNKKNVIKVPFLVIERARAAQYINKIVEQIINKDLNLSLFAIDYMPIFNILTYYFFDDSKSISQIFSMIVSNYIQMTGYEKGEEAIKDTFFRDMLLTLCRGKRSFKNPQQEIPQAVKCGTSLFSYIYFKAQLVQKYQSEKFDPKIHGEVIESCYIEYIQFLMYCLVQMSSRRDVQTDIMRAMNEDFTAIVQYQHFWKPILDLWNEYKYMDTLLRILKDEFLFSSGKKEEDSGLFNEEAIIEGIFKVLKILAGQLEFPDELFEKILKYIKERAKTIKRMKRKALIEDFNMFMLQKSELKKLQQQKDNKKQNIKKKPKLDPIEEQKKLATKYLISHYDWM